MLTRASGHFPMGQRLAKSVSLQSVFLCLEISLSEIAAFRRLLRLPELWKFTRRFSLCPQERQASLVHSLDRLCE